MIGLAVCAFATSAVGACGYQPGSLGGGAADGELAGARATVGCLDVAVAGRWGRGGPAGAVAQAVRIDFGNRCDRPVVVDFTALRAVGRDDSGREHALVIYDPRAEIRELSLEARTAGHEVLELRRGAQADARPRMRSACIDVGRLAAPSEHWQAESAGPREHRPQQSAGRARAGAPRWLCVARPPRSRTPVATTAAAAEAP